MAENELDTSLRSVIAALPGGGEVREAQQLMAHAVAGSLAKGRHLFVRAGTGTGKSLAYLLPAIVSGKRVIVATATKALQDQLADKDLPGIAAHVEHPVRFAVLKGRSNYLCLQRLREAEATGSQGELTVGEAPARTGELGQQSVAIAEWAGKTKSGDRAELTIEPDPRVWASFSVSSDECPGAFRCPSGGECFVEAARARAAAADVVIVNLHLLGAHLASGESVLPEHDALVVDEAHELEDVMTESLGVSISPGRLRALALASRGLESGRGGEEASSVSGILELAERLEPMLASRVGERLRRGLPAELAGFVELCTARLEGLERGLGAVAAAPSGDLGPRAQRAQLVAGRVRVDLARLAALSDDDVAWVSGGPRPRLEIAPIDVAPILAERLFGSHTTVLTSATLLPGLSERLGAPAPRTDELDVGSPFAFEEQALLYCAAHLPDRRSPAAEAAMHDELARLITAAGGRTLALFTSRLATERAAAALRQRLTFPLLVQGEAGKATLVSRFRDDPATCLFATMGFWQGVDVPGSTLSLVTIDRIPFSRPDDPLLSARRERAGERAFQTIDLPRAAMLLAQGAGRLVRSAEDRGVVAVLDRRLATASYRWDLVRALPPMRRTKDPRDAIAFLQTLRAEAEAAPVPSGEPS